MITRKDDTCFPSPKQALQTHELGRSAHATPFVKTDHVRTMSDFGLHRIEDDLSETWLEDWIGAGVAEVEAYLRKHAAFLAFLEAQDSRELG